MYRWDYVQVYTKGYGFFLGEKLYQRKITHSNQWNSFCSNRKKMPYSLAVCWAVQILYIIYMYNKSIIFRQVKLKTNKHDIVTILDWPLLNFSLIWLLIYYLKILSSSYISLSIIIYCKIECFDVAGARPFSLKQP